MKKEINFSGIGFEVGQTVLDLSQSTKMARNYFSVCKSEGLILLDRGDVAYQSNKEAIKICSDVDLVKIEWKNYKQAYLKTQNLLSEEKPLVNWGGDHSIAISTVGAFADIYPDGFVVWIDAHADINLPAHSLSGNFHGMPLAVLLNLENIATDNFKWLGKNLKPEKIIYIGLRDVDPFELNIIESLNIKSYFYSDVCNLGITQIANEISEITSGHPVHISFDIDSIDPYFAPSTGVPVNNGLTPNELNLLGEKLSGQSNIRSVDIVEVNPVLGSEEQVDQTYLIAFNFLKSIFNNDQGESCDVMGKRNEREHSSAMEWNL